MIVEIENSDYLVLGYDSCGRWYCFESKTFRLRRFLSDEINIKNPKIPNDWIVTMYSDRSKALWMDYGDYSDHIFFSHPKAITPYDLLEYSLSYICEDDLESLMYYIMEKAMNEVREFHGLERIEIPDEEEYELVLMPYEQRRQKAIEEAIEDELGKYLCIGEELSKTSQME